MDRALNPRLEKETIYEIYRACRLCGGGAGYKMPIVQNVVDLEDNDLNLSHKIRECVQIEVHSDDKMPPLICELCVDKVNDFYEFLELCRQTNKQTRLKLGLPMQTTPKGEAVDCILGDTGPVCITEDSDVEPLSKHKSKTKAKDRVKGKVKKTGYQYKDARGRFRAAPRPAAPVPRATRNSASNEVNGLEQPKRKSRPKLTMKRETEHLKIENITISKYKRLRSDADVKPETPLKKVKISIEECPKSLKHNSKTKSKTKRPVSPPRRPAKHPASPAKHPAKHPAKRKPSPVRHSSCVKRTPSPATPPACPATPPASSITCEICFNVIRNLAGFHSHVRTHVVTFTKRSLACNACGEWFMNQSEAIGHHDRHKYGNVPYKCRRCTAEYRTQPEYDQHFDNALCIPYDEVPDVKCVECWRYFATDKLLIEHRCGGADSRPGGKCTKCNRTYVLLKNLRKHEPTCLHGMKNIIADPDVLAQLLPIQVRTVKCDSLLVDKNGHYDVAGVGNFGFDNNSIYPYRTIKSEKQSFIGMVKINQAVKEELCSEYVYWDSTDSEEEVQTLATLALKTIYSDKCLGKVPKRRRATLELEKTVRSEIVDRSEGTVLSDSVTCVSETQDTNHRLEMNGHGQPEEGGEFEDNFNGIDESFDDIDGNKLIEALNAHINEDIHNRSEINDTDHNNSINDKITEHTSQDSLKNVENGEVSQNDDTNVGHTDNGDVERQNDRLDVKLEAGKHSESHNGSVEDSYNFGIGEDFDEKDRNGVKDKSVEKHKFSLDELLSKDNDKDTSMDIPADFNFEV